MKTKTVKFYCDLPEGWQDYNPEWKPSIQSWTPQTLQSGFKRVEILIDLPEFGGSALAEFTTKGKVVGE